MFFPTTYSANGKLLLTGEYLVLHGAKAIALPVKLGQQLIVSSQFFSDSICWQALYNGADWFSCELNSVDFSVVKASDSAKAEVLSQIFRTIQVLNPTFSLQGGTIVKTILDSDPDWGLGSSSTLISLLSQWAGVDPFALNELVFRGSGFDIACARADGSIFYTRNLPAEPITLDYPFAGQLFLVYSGQKKKTAHEVRTFLKEKKVSVGLINEASVIADEFAACCNQNEFNRLIRWHEKLVGGLIGKSPVKDEYFGDFCGEVKSLGAWGGDFYLVSSLLPFAEVKEYFRNKGLNTLFQWNDLILKRE